jgi:hypothetical protein
MPITGLTDQGASFPFLGTIRKGSPKQKNAAGKEIQGKDLDYFRFDVADKNNTALEPLWLKSFGAEPKSISVLLLDDDPDQAFDAWMKEYQGNHVLKRKCDGEFQHQWLTPQNEYSFTPKPCEKAGGGNCNCVKSAELRVVLPDLKAMGFFKVLTHSTWDILSISQQLRMVYQSAGRLRGIPFLLRRSPREIFANYGGKKSRVTKSLLSIEVHPNVAGQVLSAIEQRAFASLTGAQEQPLLLPETLAITPETVDVEVLPPTPTRSLADLQEVREKLGWTKEQVSGFLFDNFKVKLPTQLSDEQYSKAVNDLRLKVVEIETQFNEVKAQNLHNLSNDIPAF